MWKFRTVSRYSDVMQTLLQYTHKCFLNKDGQEFPQYSRWRTKHELKSCYCVFSYPLHSLKNNLRS